MIRIRCCCSKYESIKGIKKLRLEVYNSPFDTVSYNFVKQKILKSSLTRKGEKLYKLIISKTIYLLSL